ncbi:MAG: TonB-dependent receptor [Gemmatimonadetes bacterium]|nr:TonB-dependent receptor [Gemmatimonadota bacterium]
MRAPNALLVLITALLLLAGTAPAAAQTGSITGSVSAGGSGEPLFAANVLITSRQNTSVRVVRLTAQDGSFKAEDLPAGNYEVRASYIGYETFVADEVAVAAGGTTELIVGLEEDPLNMDTVIITASRRQEKVLDAPASVQVLDGESLRETSALNPADHLTALPSVDVSRNGLNQGTVVIRGFNNIFSGQTLTLVDNRIARVPSVRYNAMNLIPTLNEDIERIEVVSGPGSALYGPNATNGVVHMITRSPFDALGTSVSGSFGERDLKLGSILHAGAPTETFAYKIGATIYEGNDFAYVDPVETAARQQAIANGADPATLLIAKRDNNIKKVGVDGRIDLQPSRNVSVILNSGWNKLNAVELTGLGAAQGVDYSYFYAQARLSVENFFFQSYINQSNANDSYLLRTGEPFADQSKFIVSQAQHQFFPSENQTFTYGVDALFTRPDTKGTINGRNEDDDNINEVGAYIQSETVLSEQLTFTAAGRLDDNNRLDAVFSPRAALVYEPVNGQAFRGTYNRSFSTPTPNNYFLDLLVLEDLGGFSAAVGGAADGFDLLTKGVPKGGFTFRRDSMGGIGGLYMQAPAAIGGTGDHIPADATLMWPAVQAILGAQGTDISMIPQPNMTQVSTQLAVLNPTTAAFDPVTDAYVQDVDEMKPTINNTFEIGYKGLLGDRFTAQADVWHSRIKDFVGPLRVETPNVFYDAGTLTTYLTSFMPAAQAAGLAAAIAQIPVGTVTAEGNSDPADPFLTYRNFGDVDLTGFDVALGWFVNQYWTFGVNYSFTNKDFFEDVSGVSDIALNAPMHKAGARLDYRNRAAGVMAGTRVRFVDSFPVLSGVFVGDIRYYTLMDLNASWRTRLFPEGDTIFSFNILNVFDNEHREFAGAAEIGRVATVRVTQEIPSFW